MTILERLFSIGPVRKLIWRLWYPYLTRRLRSRDVLFLNYAFTGDEVEGPVLRSEEEPDRACIALYHHVVSPVDLQGKRVLEVSCGHGGGASWIARNRGPAEYLGIDLNPAGIRFCRERHNVTGLDFRQGDAQSLPAADASVDAVINVEASHCYPDFSKFLAEVIRVLKPGGYFLYADLRFRGDFESWDAAIDAFAGEWEVVRVCDISDNVRKGMDLNAEKNEALVENCLPGFLRSSGRDFAGVPGGQVYEALKNGDLRYRSWIFRRKE